MLKEALDMAANLAATETAGYAIVALAWAEAAMVIGATYAKRMIPLRVMLMLDNVLGVVLGLATGSLPTIVKHSVNLPLNATRAREMQRLIARVREANEGDLNIEWLKPFMHPESLRATDLVFAKGDAADVAYVVVEGAVEIVERGVTLKPGDIFGEMALFTTHGKRTATARCATDVRLLTITYEQFEQLYFQNPEFGLHLVRLIVQRFEMNHRDAELESS